MKDKESHEVFVQNLQDKSLEEAVNNLMSRCPKLRRKVVVKANMYGFPFRPGITTHPRVIKAVADYLCKKGHEVVVGDIIPLKNIDFSKYFSGYDLPDVEFINLNEIEENADIYSGGFRFRIPRLIYDNDVINVPVLKTHSETLLSCAIKNMMGVLPKTHDREMIHKKNLGEGIKRLYDVLRGQLKFHVIDAIYAQEGNGPVYGEIKKADFIFGGRDAKCIDSFATSLIDTSEKPLYMEELKRYFHVGDTPSFKLRAPDQLDEKYYTGNPSIGDRGVLAVMLDTIKGTIGEDLNFVCADGHAVPGKINIGVNMEGHDFLIRGNPPSRREIRQVFHLERAY